MNWGIRAEASLVESLRSVDSGSLMLGSNLSGLTPGRLAAWMEPFRFGFTAPTWQHVLVLVAGAILSPGRHVCRLLVEASARVETALGDRRGGTAILG
jgi:hypothetical protein